MLPKDQFQTPTGKIRKGLASLGTANGYLRIRIRIGEDRRVMTLGLADTSINRRYGEEGVFHKARK